MGWRLVLCLFSFFIVFIHYAGDYEKCRQGTYDTCWDELGVCKNDVGVFCCCVTSPTAPVGRQEQTTRGTPHNRATFASGRSGREIKPLLGQNLLLHEGKNKQQKTKTSTKQGARGIVLVYMDEHLCIIKFCEILWACYRLVSYIRHGDVGKGRRNIIAFSWEVEIRNGAIFGQDLLSPKKGQQKTYVCTFIRKTKKNMPMK